MVELERHLLENCLQQIEKKIVLIKNKFTHCRDCRRIQRRRRAHVEVAEGHVTGIAGCRKRTCEGHKRLKM
jgi:hypothetical protein